MFSVTQKKFENNFHFIYQKSYNSLPITTLFLFCDVGSVREYDKMRGASHFIEHMCFRGSQKIPQSQKLLKEFSKIGAYFNAHTTKRYTCYTIKCQDIYVEHCLEILSDMLFHSLFKETDFYKERKVIMEENNNDINNPYRVIDDRIDQMLYYGSSYEYPIDSLEYHKKHSLEYKDVVEFYHNYYRPENMFLSAVSNISLKQFISIMNKTYFVKKNIRGRTIQKNMILYNIRPNIEIPDIGLIQKKDLTNVHISIGYRICGKSSPDKYCFDLLTIIMGNKLSGRFMRLLRDKNGVVYNVDMATKYYEYTGDITFTTITSRSNLLDTKKAKNGVLTLIMKIFSDLLRNGITKEELQYAKGYYKGAIIEEMQDNMNIARYNGEEFLFFKKVLPIDKIFEKHIRPITLEQMNGIFREYLIMNNMCVCILGDNLPTIQEIRKIIYNNYLYSKK